MTPAPRPSRRQQTLAILRALRTFLRMPATQKAQRSQVRYLSATAELRLYKTAERVVRILEWVQVGIDVWHVLEAYGVAEPLVHLLVG